jgi:hypothetical protein
VTAPVVQPLPLLCAALRDRLGVGVTVSTVAGTGPLRPRVPQVFLTVVNGVPFTVNGLPGWAQGWDVAVTSVAGSDDSAAELASDTRDALLEAPGAPGFGQLLRVEDTTLPTRAETDGHAGSPGLLFGYDASYEVVTSGLSG